ncbi:MAG: hypothetical protein AAB214_16255, partial [Fibrobacterota bacterium]
QMPDLDNALITLTNTLRNLTMRQVLDVICKTAEVKMPDGRTAGLKYSIEEYAIVFTPKLPERPTLFSRMFKVDPETFVRGLATVVTDEQLSKLGGRAAMGQILRDKTWTNAPTGTNQFSVAGVAVTNQTKAGVSGVVGTNLTAELNNLARDYFRTAGVWALGVTNGPDATQVFFNDRNGLLLVRASLQDLDIIQMVIELLNSKPPLVKFAVRVFASEEKNAKPSELIPRGPSRRFFTVDPPVASVKALSAEEAQEEMETLGQTARSLPASEMLILIGHQGEIQIPDPRAPSTPKASATTNPSPAAAGVTIQLLPTAGQHGEVQASLIVSQSPLLSLAE